MRRRFARRPPVLEAEGALGGGSGGSVEVSAVDVKVSSAAVDVASSSTSAEETTPAAKSQVPPAATPAATPHALHTMAYAAGSKSGRIVRVKETRQVTFDAWPIGIELATSQGDSSAVGHLAVTVSHVEPDSAASAQQVKVGEAILLVNDHSTGDATRTALR